MPMPKAILCFSPPLKELPTKRSATRTKSSSSMTLFTSSAMLVVQHRHAHTRTKLGERVGSKEAFQLT